MYFRLEVVQVPVSDVDRAKAFYSEQAGFDLDRDHQVSDDVRERFGANAIVRAVLLGRDRGIEVPLLPDLE